MDDYVIAALILLGVGIIRRLGSPTRRAVAVLDGIGEVVFTERDGVMLIHVSGRVPGSANASHGFHIHEFGDLRNGCERVGSHFRLSRTHVHGRHAGDLGNVQTDADGKIDQVIRAKLSLDPTSSRSILGRSVVLHKNVDDLGLGGNAESLRTGNAGEKLACGVIGLIG